MAQISRPFQIALVAVVLLAGVWLFALQGHTSSTSPSSSSAPAASTPATTATSATAPAHAAAGAKATHAASHGLARTSAHTSPAAHGRRASAPSAKHSAAPAHRTSTASAPAVHPSASATHTAAPPSAKAHTPAASGAHTAAPATSGASTAHSAPANAAPAGQRTVESELAKGDVVVLLFWNPLGADDTVVHRAVQQVQAAARRSHHALAVHEATAAKVGEYGSVTRGVQVDATPTVFVINRHASAIVLTGIQDAFSIEQAIAEARQPAPKS